MKSGSDVAQWVSPVPPRWQLPDVRAGDLLSAGATQLTEHLAHDPLLKSIEQVWNANPLRDVIPLDWAGIVWALRTVWLRSLSQPSAVPTVAERSRLAVLSGHLERGGAALVGTVQLRPGGGRQGRR